MLPFQVAAQAGNRAAQSPAVGGQPEITTVQTIADSGGNLNATRFHIYKTGNIQVDVVMNDGGKQQKTQYDFTGRTGPDYITASDGLYFFTYDYVGVTMVTVGWWFNTGTENQPAVSTDAWEEIDISPTATDTELAGDVLAKMVSLGVVDAGSHDALVIWLYPGAGLKPNSTAENCGANFTTLIEGINPGAATPGVASIIVAYTDNDTDSTLAGLIATACNGQGWTVGASTNVATFTDSANGTRTDATAGTTGFTVTVTQQGS